VSGANAQSRVRGEEPASRLASISAVCSPRRGGGFGSSGISPSNRGAARGCSRPSRSVHVLRAAAHRCLEELLFAHRILVDSNHALLLERPRRGPARADRAVVLVEDLAHLRDRPIAVVGDHLAQEQSPVRPDTFVEQLLVLDALELAGALLDGPSDVVGRHVDGAGEVDRASQATVAVRVASPAPRRDRDLLDHFGEQFPALGVLGTLASLDCRPFAVATHIGLVIQRNCSAFKPLPAVNKPQAPASNLP